jgi:hypothetical protein
LEFLRRSEALALKLKDLSVRRAARGKLFLYVLIRKSKTDEFSKGVELFPSFVGRSIVPVVDSVLGKDAMAIGLKYYIGRVAGTYPGLELKVENFASHSLRRGGVSAVWQRAAEGAWKMQFRCH